MAALPIQISWSDCVAARRSMFRSAKHFSVAAPEGIRITPRNRGESRNRLRGQGLGIAQCADDHTPGDATYAALLGTAKSNVLVHTKLISDVQTQI